MTTLPKRLVILGAGAIGIEFAHVMQAFGVDVTIVEMLDTILPLADQEASLVIQKSLEKRGVHIMTGVKAESCTIQDAEIRVGMCREKGNQTIECDIVLVAAGRRPNTEDLGLASIGIKCEKGYIPVGDYYQTSVERVFAIGDVVASPMLAHVATKEGEIAVDYMAGKAPEMTRLDPRVIPDAVYCEPQLAGFGYTEKDLIDHKIAYQKKSFLYRGVGKSVAIQKTEGLVKILINPENQQILGAHIVGAEATEMIHELLLAKQSGLSVGQLARMIHAHPTLSEVIGEAAASI